MFLLLSVSSTLLEALLASAWLEFSILPTSIGKSVVGRPPTRPRDVNLAGAAHSVLVEKALDGVSRLVPACEPGELIEEVVVIDLLQKRHHLFVWTNHIGDLKRASPISEVTL